MRKYKGYWSFAPLSDFTTHTVEADNYGEASELLATWALAHMKYVDEPFDFTVEIVNPRYYEDEYGVIYDDNNLLEYWECNADDTDIRTFEEYIDYCLNECHSLKQMEV